MISNDCQICTQYFIVFFNTFTLFAPVKHIAGSGSSDIRVVLSFRKIVDQNSANNLDNSDPDLSINLEPLEDPTTMSSSSSNQSPDENKQRPMVTVIAGDSFVVGLDVTRLGRRGKKTVINLSKGGASVDDVSKQLEQYFSSFTDIETTPTVEKVIVCVGANDIRNCKEHGIRHLKRPIISLIEQIQLLFPDAKIYFQSLIPLIIQNQFTVNNVGQFNKLLFEICSYMRVYYLNVFRMFLQYDNIKRGFFRCEDHFVSNKNIHLNRLGLGLLAKEYIRIIHSNKFNPLGY